MGDISFEHESWFGECHPGKTGPAAELDFEMPERIFDMMNGFARNVIFKPNDSTKLKVRRGLRRTV
jgi:hypothetical protein